MGLLRFVPVVVLLLQIYGSSFGEAGNLPQLPGNRLAEGADRLLPNATPIHCGQIKPPVRGTIKAMKTPNQVLSSYFGSYGFTASPLSSPQSPRPGHEARFKFAEVKGGKYIYALTVDGSGESAYWLPQGGTIDIPHTPNANQPHYVFTPDFSGCSWTVTPMSNGNLRLRHVEGGKEGAQFNSKSQAEKGGPVTYAMQYKDYGYIVETRRLVSNVPGFAYMQFSGGHWSIHVQTKSCAPEAGSFGFQNHVLTGMTLVESKSSYPTISRNQVLRIP